MTVSSRKKVILVITVVFCLLCIAIFLLFIAPFIGVKKIQDGNVLAEGKIITIQDGISAVYLLDGGKGEICLVDAGNSPVGSKIIHALTSHGFKPSDVKAIFLTHGHPDHIAASHIFKNAQIYCLADEVPIVEGKKLNDSPVSRFISPVSTGLGVKAPLRDRDHVDMGSLHIDVFAVPGHTEGSAAYLVNGVLFMGDAAFATSEGTIRGAMWIFSTDVEQNDRSLKALAERLRPRADEITTMAFAHTGCLQGLNPLLDYSQTVR